MTEAERDGALRRTTGNAVKYLVTEAWADAYAEKQARHEEESRDAIGWLGYDEIGRLLNRDARDVAKGIAHRRGRLKKAFDGVESRVVTRARRRRRVFHPNQAREAVMRFRNSA